MPRHTPAAPHCPVSGLRTRFARHHRALGLRVLSIHCPHDPRYLQQTEGSSCRDATRTSLDICAARHRRLASGAGSRRPYNNQQKHHDHCSPTQHRGPSRSSSRPRRFLAVKLASAGRWVGVHGRGPCVILTLLPLWKNPRQDAILPSLAVPVGRAHRPFLDCGVMRIITRIDRVRLHRRSEQRQCRLSSHVQS